MSDHLEEANLSYMQHMRRAWSFSFDLFTTSLLMLVHGVFPNAFQKHGTGRLEAWSDAMKKPVSDKWSFHMNDCGAHYTIDGCKKFTTKDIKINVPCQINSTFETVVCCGKLSEDDDLMVIE